MFHSNLCPAELSTGSVFLTNLNQFTTPWTKEAKQIHHTLQLLTFNPWCPWCLLITFHWYHFDIQYRKLPSHRPNLLRFLTWPGLGSVSSADFPPEVPVAVSLHGFKFRLFSIKPWENIWVKWKNMSSELGDIVYKCIYIYIDNGTQKVWNYCRPFVSLSWILVDAPSKTKCWS